MHHDTSSATDRTLAVAAETEDCLGCGWGVQSRPSRITTACQGTDALCAGACSSVSWAAGRLIALSKGIQYMSTRPRLMSPT